MSRTFVLTLLLGALLTLPGGPAAASDGGTKADYDRANQLDAIVRNKIFRTRVDPNWIEGKSQFWYRVQVGPQQYEFVLVDAQQGRKRPAFDHRRLAQALARQTGQRVSAQRLPFRQIQFDPEGKSIQFQAAGKSWQCNLQNYKLEPFEATETEKSSGVEVLNRVRPSRGSSTDTSIQFVNRTDGQVELHWVNESGEHQSYGTLEAGATHDQHTYAGHVWLVRSADGKSLAAFAATSQHGIAIIDANSRVRPPRSRQQRRRGASPDGRWQALIKDRNVFVRDLKSREEFQLSQTGTSEDPFVSRFSWSPDSSKLVVYQQRAGQNRQIYIVESSPRDQLQPKLHRLSYAKPGDRLALTRPRLFDLKTKSQIDVDEQLFDNPWSVSQLRWSADSRRYTFLYNQRGHQVLRFVAVDASTGSATALVDEQSETFVDYAHKVYSHLMESTKELIWMSERDGWNHLYLYDWQAGQVKNQITRGQWVVRGVDFVDEEKRQIWFRCSGMDPNQDPYYVHYCRINFDGTGLVRLTDGDGTHSVVYSPDRRYIVDTFSRVDLPPITQLRRTSDGKKVADLETGDWSALIKSGWQRPERFQAKGRDGKTDIYGVIYRPTNFDPKQTYPVIEQIYAGPHGSHVPKRFRPFYSSQRMAELGFIVVQIDGMGTSNRSKAFHDVCWKNLGDAGFPDRIRWIRAAAKRYRQMDLSRVGIYGGSAGGQNALRALLAHPEFYHVAVADCGCHDNRMDKVWWNELWMGWPLDEHYEQQSNVTQAHRLEGKLMLIVGEMDRNVDPASTMQVVDALVRADKDFDLVVMPGTGHGAAGTRYGTRRQRDFFVEQLLGKQPRR